MTFPVGPLLPIDSLPKTRLELRWRRTEGCEYPWACDYHLVLELREFDIRGEVFDDDGRLLRRTGEARVELGGCRSTAEQESKLMRDGNLDTPFRDGVHIGWDAKRLGLPMYVVSVPDNVAQELSFEETGQ